MNDTSGKPSGNRISVNHRPFLTVAAVTAVSFSPFASQQGAAQKDAGSEGEVAASASVPALDAGSGGQTRPTAEPYGLPSSQMDAIRVSVLTSTLPIEARSVESGSLMPLSNHVDSAELAIAVQSAPAQTPSGKTELIADPLPVEHPQNPGLSQTIAPVDDARALLASFDKTLGSRVAGLAGQSPIVSVANEDLARQVGAAIAYIETPLLAAAGSEVVPGSQASPPSSQASPAQPGAVRTAGFAASMQQMDSTPGQSPARLTASRASTPPPRIADADVSPPAPPAAPSVALIQSDFRLGAANNGRVAPQSKAQPSRYAHARKPVGTAPKSAKQYRLTGNGIEFVLPVDLRGRELGRVPLLVSTNHLVQVKLRDLLELVSPIMTDGHYLRLSESQAAMEFVTLSDLRKAGLDFRYDAARDRLVLEAS